MTPLAASGFLIAITCFPLAAWIYLKAPRSLHNTLMVVFNACVGVWGLGTMWVGVAHTPTEAIWAWRVAHIGGFFLGVVFFHLVLILCRRSRPRLLQAAYLFAGIAVVLCLSGPAMSQTTWMFNSLHYHQANALYMVLWAVWHAIVLQGHVELLQGYRRAQGIERTQLLFVFYAWTTGFIGGVSVLFPMFGIPLYPFGNFSIPLYSLILTYAIVRYRVVDIRIAITRTGLLLATYLCVLGIPFLVGWWGRSWLESWLGSEWWLVPLGLCTALATAGPFAYAYLRRQAEERLLREQRRYQLALQRAARGMTQVRSVKKLARLMTRVVSRSVRVTHASLFLWDKTHRRYALRASHGPKRLALQSRYGLEASHELVRWLTQHRRVLTEELDPPTAPSISQELAHLEATLVVPGLIERRLIGFLVLGQKLSGAGYSADDLHAFTTLANEAAIAIENAMSYEELLKTNEQLKAASERLLFQERLAAASQFAMGMAHEVKNPLSAIKTFAQYLPEKYADPAFREKFFRIVQSEIDRINTIIQELSDFAKPAPLQLQPVHLAELVEETLSLLSNQCLKQAVEVQTSFGENGIRIQADASQLKQAVLNLFLNSLEAMEQGGRLEVATRVTGDTLSLQIADTGCGMSAEDQRHVWDPFFTTKERGMGLGLAIVKGVVERHGGHITLSSALGKGSMVHISLPLA